MPRKEAYLEATYPRSENRGEGYSSLLYSALSTHRDWSRYVVSGRVDDFLPVKLGEPIPPPAPLSDESRVDKRAWRRFVASLREDQTSPVEGDNSADASRLLDSLDAEQAALLDKVMVRARSRIIARLGRPLGRRGELSWCGRREGDR